MRRASLPLLALIVAGLFAACGYADPGSGTQATVGGANAGSGSGGGCDGPDCFHDGDNLKAVTLPDGLQYKDLVVGTGQKAVAGDALSMQYTGWLTNGTKFDSSRDRGSPFDVTIGKGQVIKGWDEGVMSMKVGGKRKMIIPAKLAYGDRSPAPSIPPGSTLIFTVELISIANQ